MDASASRRRFECAFSFVKKAVSVAPVTSSRKMKNQLSSAAEQGVHWAVIIGEDEMKSGKLTLKI